MSADKPVHFDRDVLTIGDLKKAAARGVSKVTSGMNALTNKHATKDNVSYILQIILMKGPETFGRASFSPPKVTLY